jgi:hypothetical protein
MQKSLQEGLLLVVMLTVIQAVTQAINIGRAVLILVLLSCSLHKNLL